MVENLTTVIKGEYDIIVCGGGPAGVCAAVAAARKGSSVLLIERMNCLGGMWTSGFVNPLFDHANKGGIMREIVDKLKEAGEWGGFWNMSFNYEYMKIILEQMCCDAGVELLYNTTFARAVMDGDTITGVCVENIDGRACYTAKYVIDATGNADVATSAGVNFFIGRESDGACQAMTLMFLLGNIPEKYKDGLMLYNVMLKAFEKGGHADEIPFEKPYMIPAPNARFAVLQQTHMRGYNPISASDITKATIEGRRQMRMTFEMLKKYDPDFADIELISSAPMLGVRESRRIDGEYTLTADDLKEGRQFEDGITTVTFNVDIHDPNERSQTCFKTKPYQIPLRCMIPKNVKHMFVAGRCISGDHIAMASYRVTADCAAMGEAVGIAAHNAING